MSNFTDLGTPSYLVDILAQMQITIPTPVQRETIPLALEGKDILASAQTGSGKTIAYGIPLLIKLEEDPEGTALVLAPTRELAMQVEKMLFQIKGKNTKLKTALLIGGAPMGKQIGDLKRKPRLIVGTPGRVNDHLERGTLSLANTRFLIVDEADRMLDMGFGIQLEAIAAYLPAVRQTCMFSATFPKNFDKLSKQYLRDPSRVAVDSQREAAPLIKQEIKRTDEKQKDLMKELETREGSIIVFVNTKRGVDRLTRELIHKNHEAAAIHGDLPQRQRERVLQSFRVGKCRIMVATDVAARGLDIPSVMHVINYDLPQAPEDYIHRIGRTGRAGKEGNSLCLIAPGDNYKWKEIVRLMDPSQPEPDRSDEQRRPSRRRGGGGGGGRSFGFAKRRQGGESSGFARRRNDDGPSDFPRKRKFEEGASDAPRKRKFDDAPSDAPRKRKFEGESFGFAKKRKFADGESFAKKRRMSVAPFPKRKRPQQ